MSLPSSTTRFPLYDLQGAVTLDFLNRALKLAFQTGILPTEFSFTTSFHDDNLQLSNTTTLTLLIVAPTLFGEPGSPHQIGLKSAFTGNIVSNTIMAELHISTPSGDHIEPGLNQSTKLTFKGNFAATANVMLSSVNDKELVSLSFADLLELDIGIIDDIPQGANFKETLRRVFSRINVVALRTQILYPKINGLPGSLPTPFRQLTDTFSGQSGVFDFKVVNRNDGMGSEMHVLFEALVNLGRQSYDSVKGICSTNTDLSISVDYQWMREILQDFWSGGQWPPRKFNTRGEPDQNGTIVINKIDFTLFDDSSIQIGTEITNISLNLTVIIRVKPRIESGMLFVDVLNINTDIEWAKSSALSIIFFVLRDLGGFLILRAVDEILDKWTMQQLNDYLNGKGIDLRRSFAWTGTPFKLDLIGSEIGVTSINLTFGAKLAIHI